MQLEHQIQNDYGNLMLEKTPLYKYLKDICSFRFISIRYHVPLNRDNLKLSQRLDIFLSYSNLTNLLIL